MMMRLFSLMLLMMCMSCSSRSQEDYQKDGQRLAIALTAQLQSIHSREELLQVAPKLTKTFDELVDVMIAARQFHHQHPWGEVPELSREAEQVNVRLQTELARICRLEGGREVVEKCQETALNRLDAFQKRMKAASLQVQR